MNSEERDEQRQQRIEGIEGSWDYPKKHIEIWWEGNWSGRVFRVEHPVWRVGIFQTQKQEDNGYVGEARPYKVPILVKENEFDKKKEALDHAKVLQQQYSEHRLPIRIHTREADMNRIIEYKDEEKPADITPLERLKILMRSSIGAIEEANERRLRCLKGWAKAENSLKTQISVALQDLEELTEDSRLDYEQTTF